MHGHMNVKFLGLFNDTNLLAAWLCKIPCHKRLRRTYFYLLLCTGVIHPVLVLRALVVMLKKAKVINKGVNKI